MLNGYGAILVSYISLNSGVVEAARIAESYIEIPEIIKAKAGNTSIHEQAAYFWSDLNKLITYLDSVKDQP